MPLNPPTLSNQEPSLFLTAFEKRARAKGYRYIAGVDEAGRGPLAGPVVAAACVIKEGLFFEGINDSKLLSEKKREALFSALKAHPQVTSSVAIVEAAEIDAINILQASLKAMALAVEGLSVAPDYLLVDGNRFPPVQMAGEAVVKGDQKSQSIAAAAILAKVTRDALMLKYHAKYPKYRFDKHKGYPTPLHRKILQELGPSPIHRHSYAPVQRACLR